MLTDDDLAGVRRSDPGELREIKVKLPVKYIFRLHLIKLTTNRAINDVVHEALTEYFEARRAEATKNPAKHAEPLESPTPS